MRPVPLPEHRSACREVDRAGRHAHPIFELCPGHARPTVALPESDLRSLSVRDLGDHVGRQAAGQSEHVAGAVDFRRPGSGNLQTKPARWNQQQAREQNQDRSVRTRRCSRDLTSIRGASSDHTRCAAEASDVRTQLIETQLIELLWMQPRTFHCHTGKSAPVRRGEERPARQPGASRHFVDRGCRRFRRPR